MPSQIAVHLVRLSIQLLLVPLLVLLVPLLLAMAWVHEALSDLAASREAPRRLIGADRRG